MKKIVLGLILTTLFVSGCGREDVDQKKLIREYVEKNEEVINEIIKEINESEEFDEESVIEKLPKDIKISDVYKSDQYNYIDFGVDEGFTSFSHYYGFYYSPTGEAKTIMGMPGKKEEFENGYKIQEEGNEDWYYTEKIVDNFYFYEAHF